MNTTSPTASKSRAGRRCCRSSTVIALLAALAITCSEVLLHGEHSFSFSESTSSLKPRASMNDGVSSASETIGVHPNSTLFPDIVSIVHEPEKAAVVVTLRKDGRCPYPYLRGRLSGPALIVLDWTAYSNDDLSESMDPVTQMIGSYRAPVLGSYFLEIETIFCHDFLNYYLGNGTRPLPARKNSFDFSTTCAEPAYQRRITSIEARIQVTKFTQQERLPNGFSVGYWKNKNASPEQHVPLYTRFQASDCFRNQEERCNLPHTSVQPFDNYEYINHVSPEKSILHSSSSNMTVCLLGSSHARKMWEYLKEFMANKTQIQNKVSSPGQLRVVYHDVRIPSLITEVMAQNLISTRGCEAFVISVGQWPIGKRFKINRNSPLPFSSFYQEIRQMLVRLHESVPHHIPIFLRSINYNPLGALIGKCPPSDWRSPLVIDGYNSVIQAAVQEMKSPRVKYIDTNHLVGPVWDASSDWCHLDKGVGVIHGLLVMSQVLGISLPRNVAS